MLQEEIPIAGMPDVTRSDSQRSDASLKPRVSFNRDVHVKRIGRKIYVYHVSKTINQMCTKTKFTNIKGKNVCVTHFKTIQ